MVIVLVLIFLLVAAVLGIGIQQFSRGQRAQTYHAYYGEVVHQLGRAALAAARQHYLERLNDPGDELHQELIAARQDDLKLPVFNASMHEALNQLVEDFPGSSIQVNGRLTGLETLTSAYSDPRERKGVIELDGLITCREVSRRIRERRAFRFSSVAPPVLSRFTLFIGEANAPSINNLNNAASGSSTGGRPLVLQNGESADPFRNGWVYLGGEKIVLNMARGESNFGEDFHLPDTITRSVFFPNQNYLLLHLNSGFFSAAGNETAFQKFPVKNAFTASSVRLFGCQALSDHCTPTLVVGDVWRRYLQAAAISPAVEGKVTRIVQLPWVLRDNDIPRDIGIPPFLFLSPRLYQVYMSQVREEPYNRSFDYITSDGSQSPPPLTIKQVMKNRFRDVYPLRETSFPLLSRTGEEIWKGSLKNFRLEPLLASRIAVRYSGMKDFARRIVKTPEGFRLHLDGIHQVGGNGDLRPFSPLIVSGRGLLCFEGATAAGDIVTNVPEQDLFSLVALSGNLELSGTHYACGLAAPGGRIECNNPQIRGFLAALHLNPDNLRLGGVVAYDPRFNSETEDFSKSYALTMDEGRLFYAVE